ncbi:MAG: PAS domain-containing sensor histidine kinase [Mucilaginibacter sp.]
MAELNITDEFYKTIDLIITPVILANTKTECQYINKAFLSQIGYNMEDIPDQDTWFRKVHPDENYRKEVIENWHERLEVAKNKADTHVHMVTKVCCANGSFKWFDIHESIFGDNKVVTFLDVDELQNSNEELLEVLQQKDILLSVIAHDVRSPLSNIRQIVNNYKEMDLSEDEVEDIFSKLDGQVEYIFNMINSLLLRTSGVMGIFTEKQEQIPLKDFFLKYRKYYQERLEKQNIDFVFELADDLTINYDPFILDVISRNLIDNAIKYTPENGKIYISCEKKEGGCDLTIRDTGAGMSDTQSERILSNKGSRRLKNQVTDGFGLGLIMAKEILEKHNGKLFIKSELGKGTSFVINLLNN